MAPRPGQVHALVDTGFFIAGESHPDAIRKHLKAATAVEHVHYVIAPVVAEARRKARNVASIDGVLKGLQHEPTLVADGVRASDLLREVERQTHKDLGVVDGLVAAVAERLHAIVYTSDPTDLTLLRDAGARITVSRIPF